MRRTIMFATIAVLAACVTAGLAGASSPGGDRRLTQDCVPDPGCTGYVSAYNLAHPAAPTYTDRTLQECSVSKGRQNEPAVAVDPRNPSVLVGSSNDYCGVYNQAVGGFPAPLGPIWLGYYRSQDAGQRWVSSLVPGYPDDQSPYRQFSEARTASSGDPVIAWDGHGRVFMGSESSDDPAGSAKTFGDVWVATFVNPAEKLGIDPDSSGVDRSKDGIDYRNTTVVSQGSSAPNLLGTFYDKTAIEADRTGGRCDGNVYFSYSRFSGNGGVAIYFSRSTDHGVSFQNQTKLSTSLHDLQFPDIAVTGNGNVYVTFREFEAQGASRDAIWITKSTDCGATFATPTIVTTFVRSDALDEEAPEPMPMPQLQRDDPEAEEAEGDAPAAGARDCGDFDGHCASGFTFFRRDTQARSTADQYDKTHEYVYIVYDATKGTPAASASTYSSAGEGLVGQAAVFYTRYDGTTGSATTPVVLSDQSVGHQIFPDVSADGGVLHAIWWDSRNDRCYSVQRPIGNCADRTTVPSLDTYGTTSANLGANWSTAVRISDVTTNPNYEQFSDRTIPFAGDYLWVTSMGSYAYTVWTDWRNTVQGADPRETAEDEDDATADVHQCRAVLTQTTGHGKKAQTTSGWSGDRCPHEGGLDQNIYGDLSP